MASPCRSSTALLQIVVQNTRGQPCHAVKAPTWPRRKFSMRASRKKRRKIWREKLSTMTNAINGRRARPIARCPKCPQSTCACSPGSVRRRR